MKKRKSSWLAGQVLPVVLLWLAGCKDPNTIGLDVLPPEDDVYAQYTDSFTVTMKSIQVDSILTFNNRYCLFGEYVDEQFGRITASTWTQFQTDGDNVIFGENPANLTLDSLVLSLNLDGFYCRYTDEMEVQIYEVTGEWPDDSLYSNDSIAVDAVNLCPGFTFNFDGQFVPNDILSIPLDASLGNKLLTAPVDSLVNNATFQGFFKGLHIRCKATGFNSREPGGMFAVNLLSNRTTLTLHYKDSTEAKSYSFTVGDDTRRFHNIRRSEHTNRLYSTGIADSLNPSPEFGFIEAGALTKLFVEVPYLGNLSPAGVNRADLVIQVVDSLLGSDDRFSPPSSLFMFYADSSGKEGSFAVSADYVKATHSYTFELDDHAQYLLNGQKENHGFILIPGDPAVTVNRAVLGGPGSSLKPKLKLIFTNIPD